MTKIPTNPDEWVILEKYASKKNNVFKIEYGGNRYVVKRFSDEFKEGMEREKEVLTRCMESGVHVPRIIEYRHGSLVMEYIPGDDCKNSFLDRGVDGKKELLAKVAGWLFDFHKAFEFKGRRGDSILANFILSRRDIYGIDFEESVEGDYLRDIGDLCTSVLRLKPAFTESRFSMVRYFLDEYFTRSGRDEVDINEQLVGSLLHYSRYSSMGDLMERWADKIQENGLASILQR
ncbi:MAG: phosphotransferase [Thermoplasmata archaeon]